MKRRQSKESVPKADSTSNILMRDVVGNKEDAAVVAVGTDDSIIALVKGVLTKVLLLEMHTKVNSHLQ